MTPHDTYLTLAAIAIDYPLAPSDRGRLEAHLAGCPACSRRASAFRGDALALGHLPTVTLPERRGAEILAAALHPGVVRNPLRLLVLAALLGLLLLGSLAVGAQLLRNPEEDLSVVLPVPTATPGPDETPGPSQSAAVPAPSRLVVTRTDATGSDPWIELVAPDGSATTRIGQGGDPAWLSAGLIVYACKDPAIDLGGICSVDPDNPGSAQLLAAEGDRAAPAPDGRSIAVHRGTVDVGETWMMAADGLGPRLISAGAFMEWSPDGAWLLGQPESAGFQVAIIGADGTGLRVLAPGYTPAWSPSGSAIAYGLVDEQGASLRTVDVATGVIETRYVAPPGSELTAPAWLPGGGIVFVLQGDLWRLDVGASQPVRLTTGLSIRADWFGDALAVSPDGAWIAFSSGGAADARVGFASVDGGWQMIETGSGPVTQPRWVPETQPAPGPDASPGLPVEPVGQTWTQATVPVAAARPVDAINAVTAGGPGFVAVGRGCVSVENSVSCEAVVWTTADGRTWKRPPVSDATDAGAWVALSGVQVGMFDVAAGTPGIVAIGYAARPDIQATTWFSPDGASWERVPLGDANSSRVNAVTWDGHQFVAVGEDRSQAPDLKGLATTTARAAVWTSTDGRTWTRVPHSTVLDVGGFIDTMEDPMTGGMRGVIAGPAGLVAVGSVCQNDPAACKPAVWTSTDGTARTRAADVPNVPGVLKAVATSRSGYVAVGAQSCSGSPLSQAGGCPALILTSPDGQAWTQQPFEQSGDLRTITWIGDRYFATAPDGPQLLWTSSDGSTWVPAAVEGGLAKPDLGFVVEWQLAATPETAVWLGPAGMETAPKAWLSVP
jgi:Putative zinc-finger